LALNFSSNKVLFGCNSTEGIVALELEDDRHIRLYRRVKGQLLSELQGFRPVIWLQGSELLGNFNGEVEVAELSGELVYRTLAVFKSWKDCLSAKKYLSKVTGSRASGTSSGYLFLNDPIHQHLLVTGQTCFLGMTPSDVNRHAD
jgi:hypothetical protein